MFTNALVLFETTDTTFSPIIDPVVSLLNGLMQPALLLLGAVAALYCIILGVKFAKAEEPQEHEKAKNHLKNAVIGFVLIFILWFAVRVGVKIMEGWVEDQVKTATPSSSTSAVINILRTLA